MSIGESAKRIDAYDKVTGRAKYTADFLPGRPLVAKVLRSTIANGLVRSMDITAAQALPGVVKVLTCFDVPELPFASGMHPWTSDGAMQIYADRLLLNRRVRYYGDEIAAVVAEDALIASQALALIRVEYEEYPPLLDVESAMQGQALHANFPHNILAHTQFGEGDFQAASTQPGLIQVEGWYETQPVQHCHIEPAISCAYMEQGRVVVVSPTQTPHVLRRVVGQALGLPWGMVRVIKPYVGGGFGNHEDALGEPLNAWLTTQVGGRCVELEYTREETFISTRVRHAIRFHLTTYARPDGTFVARSMEAYSNQGAYSAHGHFIATKGAAAFQMLYQAQAVKGELYTVFTNLPCAGAMRGYGAPQAVFALESHVDDVAKALHIDPLELRLRNRIAVGAENRAEALKNYADSLGQALELGRKRIEYDAKRAAYAKPQTGSLRRGMGVASFWYNTGAYPWCLEASTCRMTLNQDGSVQMQMPEPEIGQGADTVFSQMAAETLGLPLSAIHINTSQDTDWTPSGSGAYASRQTYVGGAAVHQTATLLKERILAYAAWMQNVAAADLDIREGNIIRRDSGEFLLPVARVALESWYNMERPQHLHAESTANCRSNALSLGCTFAEVEVDIALCRVRVLNLINVHDCGRVINPQLAAAQVHGGVSMAIGYGLSEKLLFDPATGRPLNNNFLDYKLLTTLDHPEHIQVAFVENPEPTNPYGTKALGEPPVVSVAAAIRNAVLQATGVSVNDLPLNPPALYRAFAEQGILTD